MKKLILKLGILILYIAAVFYITRFDWKIMYNRNELLLVLLGTILFSVPTVGEIIVKHCVSVPEVTSALSQAALFGGIITGLVYLVSNVHPISGSLFSYKELFSCFRPLLYGVAFYVLLKPELKQVSSKGQHVKLTNSGGLNTPEAVCAHFRSLGLSRRESEIARLGALGLTNAEIADGLYIAPTTVKRHMYVIFEKLGIKHREDLSSFLK